MARYDPDKKYDSNAVLSYLQGGAMQNMAYADQQADLQDLVNATSVNIGLTGGLYTEEEADAKLAELSELTESDLKANQKAIKSLATTNAVLNTTGILTSVLMLGGGLKAGSMAKTTSAFGTMNKANLSFAQRAGLAVKSTSLKLGSRALVLGSPAPAIMAQAYTRSRTAEQAEGLQDTVKSLQSAYEYLSSEDGSLTGQVKEDTAEWKAGYEKGSEELLDRYQSGEMTQEEYNAAYEAFVREQDEAWAKVREEHSATAEYVTEHGAAYAVDGYMAEHGVDPDDADGYCSYIAGLHKDNPDAYEAAKSAYQTRQELSTGSAFTDFLANLNATLLHYVPGLAYAEAVAIKVGDVVADFAANKIPGLSSIISYEEKHGGEGIGEIARAVCADAEARYETNQELKASSLQFAAGKDPGKASERDEAAVDGVHGGHDLAASPA